MSTETREDRLRRLVRRAKTPDPRGLAERRAREERVEAARAILLRMPPTKTWSEIRAADNSAMTITQRMAAARERVVAWAREDTMTTWNYRVMKRNDAEGTLDVVEVYYDENGMVRAWTDAATGLSGNDMEDLRKEVEHILRALDEEVLDEAVCQAAIRAKTS